MSELSWADTLFPGPALTTIDTLLERDSIAVAHDPQHTPAARALADLMDPPADGMADRVLEQIEEER